MPHKLPFLLLVSASPVSLSLTPVYFVVSIPNYNRIYQFALFLRRSFPNTYRTVEFYWRRPWMLNIMVIIKVQFLRCDRGIVLYTIYEVIFGYEYN
jgi:hypothetical protein